MTAPSRSCTELKIRSEIFPVILPKLEIIYFVIQLLKNSNYDILQSAIWFENIIISTLINFTEYYHAYFVVERWLVIAYFWNQKNQ
jgi:hypothetical protein